MHAVLYIGYWNLEDPLTTSTIVPSLREIRRQYPSATIIFSNVQREPLNGHVPDWGIELKIEYYAIHSGNRLHDKFRDYLIGPIELNNICNQYGVELIIARGAPAGSLAYLLSQKNSLPFIVESFEPHSDYMRDSGVWSRFDPRFLLQRYFERKQKKFAKILLPVSENYRKKLIQEGVNSDTIRTVPCCVDLNLFRYNEKKRFEIRSALKLQDRIVGIYVGKFGDIYYDEEAFKLFSAAASSFGDKFFLIILTQQDNERIINKCLAQGIPSSHFLVQKMPFSRVPDYLSASDFAFSTIRPATSRIYCSPIKNGEYWANGLPILTEDGIGDDTNIIKQEGGGVIIENGNTVDAFEKLRLLLKEGREKLAESIQQRAFMHRNPEMLTKAYEWIGRSLKDK